MTAHIPAARPQGVVAVPPSKSMAHRLLIGAALAEGTSRIGPVEASDDIRATVGALRQLGAILTPGTDGFVTVEGIGNGRNANAKAATARQYAGGSIIVDCGESASTLRFLLPVFSVLLGEAVFVGGPRLLARPMDAYREVFAAQFRGFIQEEDSIWVSGHLTAGAFEVPGGVSSQFISGLLWALPLLEKDSCIRIRPPFESQSYVALTRAAQAQAGVHSHWVDAHTLAVPGRQCYRAGNHTVEGDWTQGALLCVLAALRGGMAITGLPPGSLQGDRVMLDILRRCGVGHRFAPDGQLLLLSDGQSAGNTPVAGLSSDGLPPDGQPAQGSSLNGPPPDALPLGNASSAGTLPVGLLQSPGDIDLADCPDLGPALCVLAAFCHGETRLLNAGRLRAKESDRLAAMAEELGKLGVRITAGADSLTIVGGAPLAAGQRLAAHGDHRIAMALAVAALCGGVDATIDGAETVAKSWPGFWQALRGLGVPVRLCE